MRPMTRRSALKTLLAGATVAGGFAPALAFADQVMNTTTPSSPSASTTSNPPVTVAGTLSDGTKVNLTANPGQRVFDSSGRSVKNYSDGAICVENAGDNVAGDAIFSSLRITAGASNVLFNGPLSIWARSRTRPFWLAQPKAGRLDKTKVPLYGSGSSGASYSWPAPSGPMDSGAWDKGLADTGDRPDLGILSKFDANYVVNATSGNLRTVRLASDAAAPFPYKVLDHNTGKMLLLSDYPKATAYPGASVVGNPIDTRLTGYYPNTETSPCPFKMSEATAHGPAFSFLAALLYGSEYDKEEAELWANYMLALWTISDYRTGGGNGPVKCTHNQTRASAWSLRTCAQMAVMGGPNQAMFQTWLAQMIADLNGYYSSLTGIPVDQHYTPDSASGLPAIGNFETDYLVDVLAYVHYLGFTDIATTLNIVGQYTVQRLTYVGSNGPLPQLSTIYAVPIRDADGNILANWGAALTRLASADTDIATALTLTADSARLQTLINPSGGTSPGNFAGFPAGSGGYPAYMLPGAAYLPKTTIPSAAAAWAAFQKYAQPVIDFSQDPRFNITW